MNSFVSAQDIIEWGTRDFHESLAQLQPQIGSYKWMWLALRLWSRYRGGFAWGMHRRIKALQMNRPYFIGRTGEGTRYLGDHRDLYTAYFATFPDNEAGLLRFMKQSFRQTSGACLDIGANAGITAASMALACADRPVIAFEPVPETARRAAATFALNELDNVRLFQTALDDSAGERSIFLPGNHAGAATLFSSEADGESGTQFNVPCRRLDDLAAERAFPTVGFIKLDVEGNELNVLRGACELIRRDRPTIIFEYNTELAPRAGWRLEDAVNLLKSLTSYEMNRVDDDGNLAGLASVAGHKFVNICARPV